MPILEDLRIKFKKSKCVLYDLRKEMRLQTPLTRLQESVELPLTHPELYEEMGIRPPKGVILYGVPGTGKTLLAKAVANQTSATFLRVVGSELIQKYLGDGPKLVRELFRVAEEHAPSIVFIDEIDAIGTKRYVSRNRSPFQNANCLVGTTRHQVVNARSSERCWNC